MTLACIVLFSSSTIQGTGLQSRHFLYVDDVTEALLILMKRGIMGEIYNIASNFEITIIQLARELVMMVIIFVRFTWLHSSQHFSFVYMAPIL